MRPASIASPAVLIPRRGRRTKRPNRIAVVPPPDHQKSPLRGMQPGARPAIERTMVAFASGSLSPLPTGPASGVDASQEVCARISELRGATFEVLNDYADLSTEEGRGVADIIVALQSAANELGSAERRILATLPL